MTHSDLPMWLRESAAKNVSTAQVIADAREKLEAAVASLDALPAIGLAECWGMREHLRRRLRDLDECERRAAA